MVKIVSFAKSFVNTPTEEVAFSKEVTGKRYLSPATVLAIRVSDKLDIPTVLPGIEGDDLGLCVATFGAHFEYAMGLSLEFANAERPMISPMHGPNNTPNAIAGQLAIYHGTKAFAQSFFDSATAGMESLAYGASAIISGKAEHVLVVGVESAPQGLEKKRLIRTPSTVSGGGVAVLISKNLPDAGSLTESVCFLGCGRSFAPTGDIRGNVNALTDSIKQVMSCESAKGVYVDTVMFGLPDSARDSEIYAVANGLQQPGGYRYIPCVPEKYGGSKSCISTLFKLEEALSLLSQPVALNKPYFLGMYRPNSSTRRGILINEVGYDGSVGCTLLTTEAHNGIS